MKKSFASIGQKSLFAYVISSLIPVLKSEAWWIRVWDFPRLQFLLFGLGAGTLYALTSDDKPAKKALIMSGLAAGAGFDLYRILPYSPIWKRESLPLKKTNATRLSLLTVNVLQDNPEAGRLLSFIKEKAPDVILLLEVNKRWIEDLEPLHAEYKYKLLQPQENTYGLALYSRIPLKDAQIRFLIEPEVPSVHAKLEVGHGKVIHIYGLHPRPPRYQDGPTTERDAELIQIAKEVRKCKDPVIVMGDLNDVAWSHTTRLFRRISGLLDPRVGREPFPTFPVQHTFFRFPLDYIFHSKSLKLVEIERLPEFGSDHFPMYISFSLEPTAQKETGDRYLTHEDKKDAERKVAKAGVS